MSPATALAPPHPSFSTLPHRTPTHLQQPVKLGDEQRAPRLTDERQAPHAQQRVQGRQHADALAAQRQLLCGDALQPGRSHGPGPQYQLASLCIELLEELQHPVHNLCPKAGHNVIQREVFVQQLEQHERRVNQVEALAVDLQRDALLTRLTGR
jgi:hypothetical protein